MLKLFAFVVFSWLICVVFPSGIGDVATTISGKLAVFRI